MMDENMQYPQVDGGDVLKGLGMLAVLRLLLHIIF